MKEKTTTYQCSRRIHVSNIRPQLLPMPAPCHGWWASGGLSLVVTIVIHVVVFLVQVGRGEVVVVVLKLREKWFDFGIQQCHMMISDFELT